MPKLLSSKAVIKVLENNSFIFISQKGSNAKYKKTNGTIVIVPMERKEILIGTLISIIRQSNLTKKILC